MNTLLIIDDEPQIRRLLRVVLEAEGYRVREAAAGQEGLVEAASHLPDAIILDLGLPDLPGVEVLRRLREWTTTPVLILSVQDAEEDKVLALDGGADDYVTKPFNSQELLARLRVLLRRARSADEPVIEAGLLKMDLAARLVWVGGRETSLTATEYALLRELAQHAGKIVTHKHLLAAVWGPNAVEQSQYLRVYLSHIRRKLADAGLPADAIRTEVGIGYRLTLA
ncbi:MAG TPA: response regulator [Terrimicrobiaceae bacterium]|nr:response regulator [Terrimicrobiaceae bacterium]